MRNLISRFGLALIGLGIIGLHTGAQAQFTLSSTVTYLGRQRGEVWAAASLDRSTLIAPAKVGAPLGQPFTNAPFALSNLFGGGNYYIFAWRDSISNGVPDITEAQAWHPGGEFLVTSNRTVTGFAIEDPDNDIDGLPDWWEVNYGLPIQPGSGSCGPLTLNPGETVFTDTVWARVVGANAAGSVNLNVSTTNGFATNDLVLIVSMSDIFDITPPFILSRAGRYEFGRIAALSPGMLTLKEPLSQSYGTGTYGFFERNQVLKVPEYTEVTMPPAFALQFNGTSDCVQAGNVPLANTSFSIEAWARRDTSGTMDMIMVQGSGSAHLGLMFGFHWSGLVFDFYGDGALSTDVDNVWHHWAGTYDASTKVQRLYRDGVLLATNTATQNYQGSNALFIGRAPFDDPAWFAGAIDEVRIWNKVRSQAEIQADMNRGLTGTEPGLLAYYPFDEGAGTNIFDATGHGYDGVTRGSPVWSLPRLDSPTTLTCQPWNGTNGGVLAFLAHQITLGSNSIISADGKGYRGGEGVPSVGDYQWGISGEGTFSFGFGTNRATDSLQEWGGGGAGKGADGSGGGGGYGGSGGDGAKYLGPSDYGRGATNFGANTLSLMYPGGGGGGSGSHSAGRVGVAGGAGGGIVFIAAGSIDGSGTISSRGAAGQAGVTNGTGNADQGSGGGGGAGGSVYVIGNMANSLQVSATGGAGGARHTLAAHSQNGGAGSLGRIRLDLPPEVSAPANVFPAAGYTNQSLAGLSLLPGGEAYDSDYDGLSDREEYDLDTNPVNPDTDGDTLPDQWEVAYGLNPTNAVDGSYDEDADLDKVSNLVELHRGTRPDLADTDGDGLSDAEELFVYHTDPLKQDTDGDGISDFAEVGAGTDPLFSGIRYFYGPLDRLLGAQYENGLGLGYEYDGNNNLLRQVYTQRDGNTNSLPDVWEFINGLTNNTSGFVDTDGDGWSDYEEWQAGTNPRDANSTPNVLGDAGVNIASLALSFTPSNFVVGVGQLDGIGAEEIVLGADGDPGTTTNFLLVLSQTASGWSTQRVDVGLFGVTSMAVGQPANRPSAAIYLGLREPGGVGRVMEFMPVGGVWTSNTIATSTTEAAYVLGVRPGRDVLASLAGSNGPPGCPYYLTYSSGWTNVLANTNASHRGLGTMTLPGLDGVASRGLRLLDSGGIQVIGHDVNIQADAIWNEEYLRWFFLTPTAQTWVNAQAYASSLFGGNLATVTDDTLNTWLWNQFKIVGNYYWIGLRRDSFSPVSGPWVWASKAAVTYENWHAGEPNNPSTEVVAGVWASDATWNNWSLGGSMRGVVEVPAVEGVSMLVDEPGASHGLLWRGHSLSSGNLRLTNAVSILYTFVDDKNLNEMMDAGDHFVMAEYLFSGTNVTLNDVQRIALSGASLAQSYGVASVDVLYGNQQVFFSAEPDGRLFTWSATNTTASLQRQLFSANHAGKAWHALAGARTLEPGQSLIGLRVDPANQNQCDVILWPPQQQLLVLTEVPQTAPVSQILPTPNWGSGIAQVNLRIWDAEGSPSLPELAFLRPGATAWSNATIAAVNGAAYGYVPTQPTGTVHSVSWNAAGDLGASFTNTILLRARASDMTLIGDWSPPVTYTIQASDTAQHPTILVHDEPFGFTNGCFGFNVQGQQGQVVVIEASTNLINWIPIHTNLVGFLETFLFYDLESGQFPRRYYRAKLYFGALPPPAVQGAEIIPGAPDNEFRFAIGAVGGQLVVVETSTNLVDWVPLQTNTAGIGPILFSTPAAKQDWQRFYRAMVP